VPECDLETTTMGRPRLTRAVEPKIIIIIIISSSSSNVQAYQRRAND
jgi:hypothetical protein